MNDKIYEVIDKIKVLLEKNELSPDDIQLIGDYLFLEASNLREKNKKEFNREMNKIRDKTK